MNNDKLPVDEAIRRLTAEVDGALELLGASEYLPDSSRAVEDSPASLLEQCVALCERHAAVEYEPIRTIHHFACTGGTLITKCIATMPNTQVLSEIDPLSPFPKNKDPVFAPTDMIKQMRQSTRGVSEATLLSLFRNNLDIIYSETLGGGQRLVLRDHSHSHFCTGDRVRKRPSLLDVVADKFPTCSVVTVRHPVDSYCSLKANGWLHFYPPTFDEYCRRYIEFLRIYEGVPVFRYEDFVQNPKVVMRSICESLLLPFVEGFSELFDVFRLTGDSGRKGSYIGSRKRRGECLEVLGESEGSSAYKFLSKTLGYDSTKT